MKNLLATAAILAAFILPSHALTNSEMVDGAATVLLYVEYCKAEDLKPEFVLFSQVLQRKYPTEVKASQKALMSKGNQAVPGLSFVDLAPMWCAILKNSFGKEVRRSAR